MDRAPQPRLWRRRRVLLPVLVTLLLLLAAVVGWERSRATRVMVMNRSGKTEPQVRIEFGPSHWDFKQLEDGGSVRAKLPAGPDYLVGVVTENGLAWQGGPFSPREGERIIVRLDRAGMVEATVVRAWWQQLYSEPGVAE
jgi:hypothetical protein